MTNTDPQPDAPASPPPRTASGHRYPANDPTLDEAKAMFASNPGLASVRVRTDAGTAIAYRDGRVGPPDGRIETP